MCPVYLHARLIHLAAVARRARIAEQHSAAPVLLRRIRWRLFFFVCSCFSQVSCSFFDANSRAPCPVPEYHCCRLIVEPTYFRRCLGSGTACLIDLMHLLVAISECLFLRLMLICLLHTTIWVFCNKNVYAVKFALHPQWGCSSKLAACILRLPSVFVCLSWNRGRCCIVSWHSAAAMYFVGGRRQRRRLRCLVAVVHVIAWCPRWESCCFHRGAALVCRTFVQWLIAIIM